MSNNITQEEIQNDPNNVPISIEQICAAMINKFGSVEIPVSDLLQNYSDKSIAVNHDDETNMVTLTLVDNTQAENE